MYYVIDLALARGDIDVISALVGQAVSVVLYVISAYFFIRLMLALFSGQIDLAGGRPGAIADLTQQIFFLLLSLVLALDAPRMAQGFAAIGQANFKAAYSTDIHSLLVIIEPIALLVYNLVATLVVSMFMITVVLSAVRSQVANLMGSSSGLVQGLVTAGSAVLVFAFGLGVVRAGGNVISYFGLW